jgi:pimeloyl-ACP methyl ester carboxylesterase
LQKHFLLYKKSTIHYSRFGTGSRLALCFHGYGESEKVFHFLEKEAGNHYTFLAIDLPFHGQTVWNEGLLFTPLDLQQIVAAIIKEAGTSGTITLLGYSLGGRIALRLYQSSPESIDQLVLLAPDGLTVNPWYWFATQTWLGNRCFKLTMHKPGWFFGLLQLGKKLGWVNSSVFKFVQHAIGDAAIRKLLYERWTALRKIRPCLPHIKKQLQQQHTIVRLVYGKHDRIILPVRGELFCRGIEAQSSIRIIHSGHQLLHPKHTEEIVQALLY